MYTVVSSLKLLSLIVFWLIVFLGLGWLVVGPILHYRCAPKIREVSLSHDLPLMLIIGMILNYGIVVIFKSLRISLIIESALSLFGISLFVIHLYRNKRLFKITLSSLNKWIGIAFLCLLFLGPILANSLYDWDARSIWFFHAKLIYYAGNFGLSAGWQQPSVGLSHVDYPNLLPTIAAQICSLMGFWNENLPKLSLLFLLLPALIWIFTFSRKSFSFIFLLLLFPFSIYPLIWNGYMDGYLAFYFAIALLLYGRYLKTAQTIDLISSLSCLIFLIYLKNEGSLAVLCGIFIIVLIALVKKQLVFSRAAFRKNWKYLLTFLVIVIPFGIWTFYKKQWGLSNDLQIGTENSLLRILTRLSNGSLWQIFTAEFNQLKTALMILGMLYFAAVIWKKRLPEESLPTLITTAIYCLGITFVYLLTPNDLSWHLINSIERTMLPVNGCIFIGCYFLLDELVTKRISKIDSISSGSMLEPMNKRTH